MSHRRDQRLRSIQAQINVSGNKTKRFGVSAAQRVFLFCFFGLCVFPEESTGLLNLRNAPESVISLVLSWIIK